MFTGEIGSSPVVEVWSGAVVGEVEAIAGALRAEEVSGPARAGPDFSEARRRLKKWAR